MRVGSGLLLTVSLLLAGCELKPSYRVEFVAISQKYYCIEEKALGTIEHYITRCDTLEPCEVVCDRYRKERKNGL